MVNVTDKFEIQLYIHTGWNVFNYFIFEDFIIGLSSESLSIQVIK